MPQNRSYWGLLVEPIVSFYTSNNGKFMKDMYLAFGGHLPSEYEDMITQLSGIVRLQPNKDLVHLLLKKLFNDGETTRFIDGEEKATVKMMNYETKIRGHFAKCGLDLKEPNETSY